MIDTEYTVVQNGGTFRVLKAGKIFLGGFPTKEMALHGIWVEDGRKKGIYFSCEEETVVKEIVNPPLCPECNEQLLHMYGNQWDWDKYICTKCNYEEELEFTTCMNDDHSFIILNKPDDE